jgi:vitamin-K-epoxide reductase (warfarin-sensitive)
LERVWNSYINGLRRLKRNENRKNRQAINMNITLLRIVTIIGILVSAYAISVETKVKKNQAYKPVCDINDRMSCSKAFKSEYGHLLGVSNSIAGMASYIIFFALTFFMPSLLLPLAIVAVLSSIALAYLMYVKMRIFCFVCTSIYTINILLLLAAL